MCGRFFIPFEGAVAAQIEDLLAGADGPWPVLPSGEIFPTDSIPVITRDGASRASWGYPTALRDARRDDINARSETVLKSMERGRAHAARYAYWSDDIFQRRVAIPSGGFFEWPHDKSLPYGKYLFSLADGEMMFFAGVSRRFSAVEKGMNERVVILTTAANGDVQPYHNRMPVLLRAGEVDAWLNDEAAAKGFLARVCPALKVELFDAPRENGFEQMSMFD